jgi:O-antigen/teichoic acid export membrane protein
MWLVGGRTVRSAISLVIGVWMARYLGPDDYGVLNSALAVVAILMAFSGLGLDSIVRQEIVRRQTEAPMLLGTCMALRVAAGCVAYGFLMIIASSKDATLHNVWLVAGLMLLTHVPLTLDFWFQARLELRYSTIAQNTAFGICSALRLIMIWHNAPVVWFAAAIVLEGPLCALLLLYFHGQLAPTEDAFAFEKPEAIKWLRACWPLVGAALLAVAFTQLNQVLLVWLSGKAEAGRYAAANRVFEIGSFVLTALVMTRVPEIAAQRDAAPESSEKVLRGIMTKVCTVAWPMAIGLAVAAPLIVKLLFGSEFDHTENAVRFLSLAFIPFGLGLVRHEYWVGVDRTRRLLVANIVGAAVNLILGALLMPKFGATGAAIATFISLTVANIALTSYWADSRAFGRWQWAAVGMAEAYKKWKADRRAKAVAKLPPPASPADGKGPPVVKDFPELKDS